MIYAKYNKRDDYLIPSEVILGDNITPVWLQQRWTDGEFSEYIVRNGCGHCCTAMTANLKGIKITPYEEYELCRKLWGAPNAGEQQDHFLSVAGIVKVLKSVSQYHWPSLLLLKLISFYVCQNTFSLQNSEGEK